MKDPFLVLGAIIALGLLYVVFPVFLNLLGRFRKEKTVTCPRRYTAASVGIDARKAALTGLKGEPKVQIKDCSLWQEEMYCEQECLNQL